MSILTTIEVAAFLGIESTEDGLAEAIEQAEAMVAAKMRLHRLEEETYTESRTLTYPRQQVMPKHGPITNLSSFTVEGDNKLSDVQVDSSGWSIHWSDPLAIFSFDRVRSFKRMAEIQYTYTAGWTASTLPTQVKEAVKAMTGVVFMNLLASGVYDTKLGDMTIKVQREVWQKNLEPYDRMLGMHGRPY